METFTAARQAIRIERFEPKTPGPHRVVLVMHGADGLPGRGLPYRELTARIAEHGYLTFLPHYFDATGGQPRPNPLNPVNFMAWMGAIREAIGYALEQPNVADGSAVIYPSPSAGKTSAWEPSSNAVAAWRKSSCPIRAQCRRC
jgi:hypothetical protein